MKKSVMKAMVEAERSLIEDNTTVGKIKLKIPISQLLFGLSNRISNLLIAGKATLIPLVTV